MTFQLVEWTGGRKYSSVDSDGVISPIGIAGVRQEMTAPALLRTRSIQPFRNNLRSGRLRHPFLPLFGVASIMAFSRLEVQIHEVGSSLARSPIYPFRAMLFGACSPL